MRQAPRRSTYFQAGPSRQRDCQGPASGNLESDRSQLSAQVGRFLPFDLEVDTSARGPSLPFEGRSVRGDAALNAPVSGPKPGSR